MAAPMRAVELLALAVAGPSMPDCPLVT